MPKYWVLLLLIIVVPQVSLAQKGDVQEIDIADVPIEGADFRDFIWGVTPAIVKENETATFASEDENFLFFIEELWGIRTIIGYEFSENKLVRGRLFLEKIYGDQAKRIEELITIQSDLEKRWGKPSSQLFRWKDDREKDYPKYWGWAIYRAELDIKVTWEVGDTEVILFTGASQPHKPEISIDYASKTHLKKIQTDPKLFLSEQN